MLLQSAIRALERHRSVSAEMRLEGNLFEQRGAGFGRYAERRAGGLPLTRLEFRLQLGGQASSLLQVCDGQFLWSHRKLGDSASLSRIDVEKALDGLRKAANAENSGPVEMLPGLGGLPRMLRALYGSFDFTTAEPGRWGKDERPVWRLTGGWKPRALARALPDQEESIEAGEPPDLTQLPPQMPDHVRLTLGASDLFPYRIEWRRKHVEGRDGPESPDGRALVTMEFYDVVIDGQVDAQFEYVPSDTTFSDDTDAFVRSLGIEP